MSTPKPPHGAQAFTDVASGQQAVDGGRGEDAVAYAVCYIRSEAPQRGLQMLVGSDDQVPINLAIR